MTNKIRLRNFINREKNSNKQAYETVKKNLKQIIDYILQYDIKKIYLFGSILHRNEFHYDSDVDIAVDGISFKKFSKLWFELGLKFPVRIDLINFDDCGEYFRNAITKRGKLIYEK